MLSNRQIQLWLARLGYYAGGLDGIVGPQTTASIKHFQADYNLSVDGVYGPNTDAALQSVVAQLQRPPLFAAGEKPDYAAIDQLWRFRLTEYWISDAADGETPLYGKSSEPLEVFGDHSPGSVLFRASDASYISASLEGTIRTPCGELLNVAGSWRHVSGDEAEQYRGVYNRAKAAGWLPERAGYAGLQVDGSQITAVMEFKKVAPGKHGYPIWRGIDADPFRTIATDTAYIPSGSWCYIAELYGVVLPDGSTHDGWVQANDVGGAIKGAHIDLFVGHESNKGKNLGGMPSLSSGYRCHLWATALR
jgi:3D (Asp-Asp-Asp) domain-containing protein